MSETGGTTNDDPSTGAIVLASPDASNDDASWDAPASSPCPPCPAEPPAPLEDDAVEGELADVCCAAAAVDEAVDDAGDAPDDESSELPVSFSDAEGALHAHMANPSGARSPAPSQVEIGL